MRAREGEVTEPHRFHSDPPGGLAEAKELPLDLLGSTGNCWLWGWGRLVQFIM